jgi:hypothetical protein
MYGSILSIHLAQIFSASYITKQKLHHEEKTVLTKSKNGNAGSVNAQIIIV